MDNEVEMKLRLLHVGIKKNLAGVIEGYRARSTENQMQNQIEHERFGMLPEHPMMILIDLPRLTPKSVGKIAGFRITNRILFGVPYPQLYKESRTRIVATIPIETPMYTQFPFHVPPLLFSSASPLPLYYWCEGRLP